MPRKKTNDKENNDKEMKKAKGIDKKEERRDKAHKNKEQDFEYTSYDKLIERAYELLPSSKQKAGERFQMPEMDIIIEGNKTIIKNFQQIAEKIRRQKGDIAAYLKKELGAPVRVEEASLVIQKKIKPEFLKRKIELYIEDFVICQECKRPDTHIASIQGIRFIICEACGARRALRK
ncbi:MAG: translation initiation factor IF-2 subunit beta [Candidatus Anstonellales archaeon]